MTDIKKDITTKNLLTEVDGSTIVLIEKEGKLYRTEFGNLQSDPAQFQKSETHLQWKRVGDVSWTDLVALSEINGSNGTTYYPYTAWASDDQGSDFSLTPSANLKYRADIHSTIVLDPPTASDFDSANWVQVIYVTESVEDLPLIGDLDGVNDTFDLAQSFLPNTVVIWDGGVRLKRGVDFTDSTGQIVFTTPPSYADLSADIVADTNTVTDLTPTGLINGSNTSFTLANTPILRTVTGFRNGLKLKRDTHFTVTGNQVEYVEAPLTGDILSFDYKY